MTLRGCAGVLSILIGVGGCARQTPSIVARFAEEPLQVEKNSRRPDSTLMSLAHLWSGGASPARCGRTPPPREPLSFPGGRYCEVLSPTRGRIGFRIDQTGRIRLLTWDRITDSRAHARSVGDSLDVVLRDRSSRTRLCRPDSPHRQDLPGMLWESGELVVHLSWTTPGDERPKLLAMAVDDPKEFPFFLCKPFDQARSDVSRKLRKVTE
jgi:hypothetical protein